MELEDTRNKQRDVEVQHQLARMGWHVMTVWECQLDTKEKRESTLMAIEYTLNHIYLMDREATEVKPCCLIEKNDVAMVAEEIQRATHVD